MKIKIHFQHLIAEAELNQTETAKRIYSILPIKSTINTWGDEIYFSVPINMPNENPTEDVDIGDLAYWPEGPSFCIFFGRTPASASNKPKPASPVTIIGKIKEHPNNLKKIKSGEKIILENDQLRRFQEIRVKSRQN